MKKKLEIELSRDYENVWEWIWNKRRDDRIDFNISREHNGKTGEYYKPLRIIISSKRQLEEYEIEKYQCRIVLLIESDLYKGEFSLSDREINSHVKTATIKFVPKSNTTDLDARFRRYLLERKAIHLNDSTRIYVKWNELIEMLAEKEFETIKLIKSATKDEIDYISEVMEEVSAKLNSNQYISTLKEISDKYPESDLKYIIERSIKYMNKE